VLVLFFALGTVHVTLAIFGQVWHTSQLLAFLFVGLAYLSAIQLDGAAAFFITGLFMGSAMLTRNHLLFAGIWPAYHLIEKNWCDRTKLFKYISVGLLPVIIMGLLFLYYNFVRFGDPAELGYSYHQMAPFFRANYQKYGPFNLHYLPTNFYYQYIHYPFPFRDQTTLMGNSLFLLSPVFFFAFKGIYREYRNPNIILLIISIVLTSIPILLLMGTGWVQYGPRYTLDFTIPLLLLTACGVQGTSMRLLVWLTVISILHYIPGIFLYVELKL
jgi:hypothetical protein